MSLPHPRKPNEYIATQGPLPQTCDDFWQVENVLNSFGYKAFVIVKIIRKMAV